MKQFFTSVALLTILITLCSCVAPSNSSSESSSTADSNIGDSSQSTSSQPPTEPIEPEEYSMGKTISISEWEITPNAVEVQDRVQGNYNSYFTPDDGNKYVVVHLTIKNIGTSAKVFLSPVIQTDEVAVKLSYQDKYTFVPSNLLAHPDELHMASLNPLSAKTGIVAFQVADEAAAALPEIKLIISNNQDSFSFDPNTQDPDAASNSDTAQPTTNSQQPVEEHADEYLEEIVVYENDIAKSSSPEDYEIELAEREVFDRFAYADIEVPDLSNVEERDLDGVS